MKRAFDIAVAAAVLAVSAPVWAVVAAAITVADGRPVLFRQVRVGHRGQLFTMLKFRTMRAVPGRHLTIGRDQRITRVGRLLRSWKLDELPQLLNVLRGEMSLVGWRPELPEYVDLADHLYAPLLEYRPGIIDPATLRYRRESELLARARDPERFYIDVVLPDKVTLSLDYAQHASLRSDLRLLSRLVA